MKRLAIAAIIVFVVGTVAAVLFVGGGEGTVIDMFTYLDQREGMRYFISVRLNKRRQTVEVTEAVYNAHSYGDVYNPAWAKNNGYSETDVKSVGDDKGGKPDRSH